MIERPEALPAPPPAPPPTAARRRLQLVVRLVVFGPIVLLAAAIATGLTVDLGPAVRARAEAEGSKLLERPLHIGKLSIRLRSGEFLVEDLLIEGLTPADRPFLTARTIAVSFPWWTVFSREIVIESIQMTDWQMAIESFPGDRHSFPRIPRGGDGPKRFTTTLKYVQASRGHFVYEDHGTPWSVVAPDLTVTVVRPRDEYRGEVSFRGGTVRIQTYEPMSAALRGLFVVDGTHVRFDRIDLQTYGAESVLTGEIDLGRWPEQIYDIRSRVQLPQMREIFFAGDTFTLDGDARFTGTFHLFRGGRELRGSFASDLAGVNDYRFPDLEGRVVWLPDRLDVPEATAAFLGGRTRFTYAMAPLGDPERPAMARFQAAYTGVDLAALTDFLETEGLRLSGRATGENLLEWPVGRFRDRQGGGRLEVEPPSGVRVLPRDGAAAVAAAEPPEPEIGPFNPHAPLGYVPVGGEIVYRFGPEWVELERSWAATAKTHVAFHGRTAWGERSTIPFQVGSADWQESDRVLAAVLTAFGSRTGAVQVGGWGGFDGVMYGPFRAPRIEGVFEGGGMRAWDVLWGRGRASLVIEDGYVEVTDGLVSQGDSEIHASGRFSLGYPRRDGGEEINARIRLMRRPVADLRHAFALDDYPLEGRISGDYHVYGRYERPFGFGRMVIEDGVAYGEPFEIATAGLRFEGQGVRLDGIEMRKAEGTITGAAYVAWDGTYSFNADGRRIPLEAVAAVEYPELPLSGLLQFTASGAGAFEAPRYDVRGRLDDLFAGDEGIGQVTGRISVRNELLTLELEAASPRLAVSGSGRIALTPEADAELTFRFADTSLDPYVRLIEPRLSPFTTAVASGTVRVAGELQDPNHLLVDGTIEQFDLTLFDYRIRNDGPIRLTLDRNRVQLTRLRLVGEDTQLDLTGSLDLNEEQIAMRATGDANLGILQGFFRDIRSSGSAELVAEIHGPARSPQFSGHASVRNGRIRHFSLPHSLEAVNGRIAFDAGGVRFDEVTGRMGGGLVRFGGRIGLDGYLPGEVNVTAVGEQMRLRYPEGFRSVVDADLALRGDFFRPLLTGNVLVRSAAWTRRFEGAGLFGVGGSPAPAPAMIQETLPLSYDVRILAPSTLRVENNLARIVSSAELTLRGTFDRPLLFGRAEIERGEVLLEGNRYLVTRGTIDFANPSRIEPFVDIEAETRVRVPGQTYRVVFQVTGTSDRFVYDLSSDPPLADVEIVSLLFGDLRDPQELELQTLRRGQSEAEQDLIQARAARLLASPVATGVGRAVEQTFGVDTVQIMPSLIDPSSQQWNPTARVTIGKRISDRIFVTFSRALASNRDQIILLEYDQSDRLSWVVSQNGDSTYALDFRVRHTF